MSLEEEFGEAWEAAKNAGREDLLEQMVDGLLEIAHDAANPKTEEQAEEVKSE